MQNFWRSKKFGRDGTQKKNASKPADIVVFSYANVCLSLPTTAQHYFLIIICRPSCRGRKAIPSQKMNCDDSDVSELETN